MNNKHRKILSLIYTDPVLKNIKWSSVKSLMIAVKGSIEQGNGSRIRIVMEDMSLNIHTPHPGNELKPYQVRAIRKLLKAKGLEI